MRMKNRFELNRYYKISISLLIISSLIIVGVKGPAAYAQQGKEITISLNSAYFTSLAGGGNHQIKVVTNYTVSSPSVIGQKINAVMKIYSANGTLLKTTSFPAGFTVNKTGTQQFLTNLPNSTSHNITAVATFTNLPKTLAMSNPLKVPLNLGQSLKG
jgi:hypothetical protein